MDDLIRRQDAIDAFKAMEEYEGLEIEDEAYTQAKEDGIEILTKLPSAQPEPQWIPCSERLPEEDYWTGNNFQYSANVLMTVYNAGDEETIIDYGHTTDGKWYSDTTDCYVPYEWEVIAWMPLPEPYKENSDE